MPVYPKKKTKILASGGPLIGLQYTPTKAKLPDLEGVQMLVDAENKNEAFLQAERAKRQIDPETFRELTKGAKGFGADQDRAYSRYRTLSESYNQKAIENPNFVFSPEGRRMLREIEYAIDPSEMAANAQRYEVTSKEFQDSKVKNETLIRDGKYYFYDQENNKVVEVPVNQSVNALRNPNMVHLKTESELYGVLDKTGTADFNATFGKGVTTKDAIAHIRSYFEDLGTSAISALSGLGIDGSSGMDVLQQIKEKTKSNSQQRKQAVNALLSDISPDVINRLRANYVERTGDYTDSGFAKNFENTVLNTSGSFAVYERDVDRDYKNLPESYYDKLNTAIEPAIIEGVNIAQASDDPWVGLIDGGSFGVLEIGTSSIMPDQTPMKMKRFNGTGFVFANTGVFGNKTSEVSGKPVKMNMELKDVVHEANVIVPVRKGTAYKKTSRGWEPEEDKGKGRIVTVGRSDIPESSAPIMSEQGDYYYLLNEDGDRIVVERKYAHRYSGLDEGENKTIVYDFPNQHQTIQETGRANFSLNYTPKKYFTEGEGWNADGRKALKQLSENLFEEYQSGKISEKEYNNTASHINNLVQQSLGREISTRSTPTPNRGEEAYLSQSSNLFSAYKSISELTSILESMELTNKETLSNLSVPQRDPKYRKESYPR